MTGNPKCFMDGNRFVVVFEDAHGADISLIKKAMSSCGFGAPIDYPAVDADPADTPVSGEYDICVSTDEEDEPDEFLTLPEYDPRDMVYPEPEETPPAAEPAPEPPGTSGLWFNSSMVAKNLKERGDEAFAQYAELFRSRAYALSPGERKRISGLLNLYLVMRFAKLDKKKIEAMTAKDVDDFLSVFGEYIKDTPWSAEYINDRNRNRNMLRERLNTPAEKKQALPRTSGYLIHMRNSFYDKAVKMGYIKAPGGGAD